MNTSRHIAKHFREVYFGGNWTACNLKDTLADITWEESIYTTEGLNTIAVLVHHIHYYVKAVTKVLEGEELNAKDELSFNHPSIENEEHWNKIKTNLWTDAEHFADLIESLPNDFLEKHFTHKKYGLYYRNLTGIIEHTHYHLGQIVILKKLIRKT